MSDHKPTLSIPAKSAPVAEAESPKTAAVRIKYDTWIGDERIVAPAVVELPMDRAKALLAAGKAERADPMPGDA